MRRQILDAGFPMPDLGCSINRKRIISIIFTLIALWIISGSALAGEYEFDPAETEKKPYHFGGYLEFRPVLMGLDKGAVFNKLKFYNRDEKNPLPEYNFGLQLEGSYEKGISRIFVRTNTNVLNSYLGWSEYTSLYEGTLSLKPSPALDVYAGKKTLKWGKGYAWNPVAFLDRPKNPDEPELNLEGFVVTGSDYIRSFEGPMKTFSFTPVILPAYQGLNDDFGGKDQWNFAGKFYFLVYDTDIDFLFLSGGSKSPRYGIDFSRNLGTNLEIHGEAAWIEGNKKNVVDSGGRNRIVEEDIGSYLLGLRYLSDRETTTIIEYYHNGGGYTAKEMGDYYSFIDSGYNQYNQTGNDALLRKASTFSMGAYGKPTPMQDYLYFRISQKEPFDILYFTPALTGIINLEDKSFSLSPELLYTGFTNWELRLKGTTLSGKSQSEYGEKSNDYRIEFRVRYYF
ncbi:MAG: hypothetical protein V2B13_03145 [Pseudomonadota bacterium]